jgi:hypothetical protein
MAVDVEHESIISSLADGWFRINGTNFVIAWCTISVVVACSQDFN